MISSLDLCDPTTARLVARRAGVRLRRRLGQHLLTDRTVLERLLEALAPEPGDEVWEIGAGIGTLTAALAPRVRRVVAVELDPACIRALEVTLRGVNHVEVVCADALDVNAEAVGLSSGYLATGNLPYQITGALLRHLLEGPCLPRRVVVLVQREVAERLSAPSGDWSLATLAVRTVAAVERLGDIAPSSFTPAPRVHSSILRLHPHSVLGEEERRAVLALGRAAFQLRRKVLRHGITRAVGDEGLGLAALAEAGIDPRRRPGTLEVDEWRALAKAATTRGWRP